jgi:hypothetical protein
MEVNFKKDLQELLNAFAFAQTNLEQNQCVIAVMNCILNYTYIEEFLSNYPSFTAVLESKCYELILSPNSTINVKDLCTRVLQYV